MITEQQIDLATQLKVRLFDALREEDETVDVLNALAIISIMKVGILIQLDYGSTYDAKHSTDEYENDLLEEYISNRDALKGNGLN